jgi:hypothetical protein
MRAASEVLGNTRRDRARPTRRHGAIPTASHIARRVLNQDSIHVVDL